MTTDRETFSLQILGPDEDVPRLLTAWGHGCGGEVAFAMRPRDGHALLVHHIKRQPATAWRTDLGLAPSHAPELPLPATDAVAELRRLKANLPPVGPATLRGRWSGHLYCTDGKPSVRLERKLVSYGTLRVASGPDGRWTATFDRKEKWFGPAKAESVERSGLAEAITAGMGLVVGLVSEACSFRDMHRRNAVDATWAAQHPYRAPAEPKDRTDKFRPRSTFRAVEVEDAWVVVNEVGATVAKFGKREKGKATRHASALTRGKAHAAGVSPDIAAAFGPGGALHVLEVPPLDTIPAPEPPSCPTSAAHIASATEKEADALGELAQSLWGSTEAPELLARAGKLIRHAQALVASPLCKGTEQKAALEDVRRAAGAYQQVSDALGRGEKPDVVATLRRIAERVSLAAARAAKACAGGAQKARRTAPVTVPMQPVWPPAAPSMPVQTDEKPKRTRKAKAPEVDPEKDKLLVDAFADAIRQAAAQMGGGGG